MRALRVKKNKEGQTISSIKEEKGEKKKGRKVFPPGRKGEKRKRYFSEGHKCNAR